MTFRSTSLSLGPASDPNYGTHLAVQNRPNGGGIMQMSYDSNSMLFNQGLNPSHNNYPQQQQSFSYNGNNAWQQGNGNNNQYGSYNRYPAGSAGWYATGGNYQYNKARPLPRQSSSLLLISFILFTCF